MKANLDGCIFEDNGVGILAVGDVEFSAANAVFRRNGTAVDIQRPDLLRQVGLPAETPFNFVEELAEAIVKAQDASVEEKLKIASDSRLAGWLANTGHVVRTAKDLIDIAVKVAVLLG